jgi:hypothetical protein
LREDCLTSHVDPACVKVSAVGSFLPHCGFSLKYLFYRQLPACIRRIGHCIAIVFEAEARQVGNRKRTVLRHKVWPGNDFFCEKLPHDLVAVVHVAECCFNLVRGAVGGAGFEDAAQTDVNPGSFCHGCRLTEAHDAAGFIQAKHDDVSRTIVSPTVC